MKIYFLILILFVSIAMAQASQQPYADKLEHIFTTYLPLKEGVIYTKVPRGLVISIDEKVFFSNGEIKIKQTSLPILDIMADILKNLPNEFVIENHTTEIPNVCSPYKENWELSIARASNLVQYFTVYKKLSPDKITSLGLAEYVPYRYKTKNINFDLNNRIDFVIIEYEAMR